MDDVVHLQIHWYRCMVFLYLELRYFSLVVDDKLRGYFWVCWSDVIYDIFELPFICLVFWSHVVFIEKL